MTPLALPDRTIPDRFSYTGGLAPRTRSTVVELPGPGCIRHIWMTICREHLANRKAILRIYFDGSKIPHVEAPAGDFFGVLHGQQWYPLNTRYLSVVAESGYNCYFAMPFAQSARIEIETGDQPLPLYIMIDWHRYPGAELTETRRFCARWRREFPTKRYDKGFLIADIDGPGDFLGFVYGVRLLDNRDRWSHGGADNFYVDGLTREPFYLRGIGGEDTFGTSYGGALHPPETHLHAGMPYYVHEDIGEARVAQRLVGYRFFEEDSISFQRSLELRFGCMENDICATAYWYQSGAPRPYYQLPDFPQLLPGAPLAAQTQDLPRPISGHWWLSGPFANHGTESWEQERPAETGPIDPRQVWDGEHSPGSPYLGANAVELGRHQAHWQKAESHQGFIDLNHYFACAARGVAMPSDGIAIARCRLTVPQKTAVQITIGWDDQAALRLNGGTPIDLGHQSFFRSRTLELMFEAGENEISLKLSNTRNTNHGGWAFSFAAETAEGRLIPPTRLPE